MIPEFTLRTETTSEDRSFHPAPGDDGGVFARDADVTRVFRLATEGASVEIVGPRWSGRTEILRRVRQLYAHAGRTAVMVRGVGDRLPLEAIRVALPVQAQGAGTPMAVSPSALVARFAAVKPSVILIDDCDRLDHASWVVVEQVHRCLGTVVVATRMQRPSRGPADHSLIRFAHPVVRVSLDELSPDVIHDLLEHHLGGAVAPSLSGRIHTASAGSPGLAIAVADAALNAGGIRRPGSVWTDGPELWSSDLGGAFEALVHSYEPEVSEAAETLALAGTVELATARALIGQPMIETLERNALVKVFVTGRRTRIAVSPPGLGDYFGHLPVSARRLRIVDTIARTLAAQGPVEDDTAPSHPSSTTEADAGLRRGTAELPLVARMFTESHATQSAAAFREWSTTGSVASAIRVLNHHLTGPRDAVVVERVLAETDLDAATAREELTYRFLQSRWVVAQGGCLETATAVLRAEREGFAHEGALEALRCAVAMELVAIPSAYESMLRPLTDAAGIDGAVARLVLAYGHILSSRAAEAYSLLDEPPADDDDRMFAGQFVVAKGLASYGCGRLSEAAEWATAHLDESIADIERMTLAGHTYVAVIALAALGRFAEAADAARVALSAGVSAASLLFAPDRATMHVLAIVAMRVGRSTAAEGLLERAGAEQRADAVPFGDKRLTVAAATSCAGDRAKAAATSLAAAGSLAARGYRLAADGATMLSLMADFDPAVADEFRPRAETVGGPLYAAYLDGRAASLAGDPGELVRAARILRAEQACDEALRYFTQAITIYRDRGDETHSAEIRAEVRCLLARDDSMGSWRGARSAANIGLTSREAEIVQYVASGLGNSDIADRFGISVRTVETHLRNIRRKTGVVQREDIAGFGFDDSRR